MMAIAKIEMAGMVMVKEMSVRGQTMKMAKRKIILMKMEQP